ncbi:hypothetical protein PMAYCL1PPCAC_31923 [Pristionchus mayeri]|uniref:Ig-like domain-containing protein n=1 Tax=Pristionchus mayeri TaxID=1317129 RepID=A0AAN5DDV4_9BILA|nr:hypothetical protein PMAYCL1PPCAC_31923 [Pristionchus mayeri]
MRLTHLLGVACLLGTALASFEDTTMKLLTANHTEINKGQTLTLKCEFHNIDKDDVVIWKKGNDEPLFMDQDAAISDYRLNVEVDDDGNGKRISELTITDVEIADDNTYYCGTMETDKYLSTRVKVNVAPSAHISPEHWPYTVILSDSVSLRCSATGNPTPKVHWSKEGGKLGSHVSLEGEFLRIPSAQMSDAGTYICTVNSTAGEATAKIEMKVHDSNDVNDAPSKPWARSPVEYVPVEMGGAVNISCQYDGNPSPQIEWSFNGAKLTLAKEMVRNKMKQFAVRYANYSESILQINDATADYFGDYSCKATNQHDTARAVVYVTAMPSRPELSIDGTVLTMTAMAPNGLDEFALFFRRPDESGWINKKAITVSKVDQTGEKTWSKQVNLADFLESGEFQIQVQARNGYGYGNKAPEYLRVTMPDKSSEPTASSSLACFSSAAIFAILHLVY